MIIQVKGNFESGEEKGTKGIYLETVNLDSYMSIENEFLVKNGSRIQIEDIELHNQFHHYD